jgi:riboflavin kinase/FMN adenylyltransferase
MRIIHNFNESVFSSTGCIVTIGNFDGVHLGHQVILKRTQDLSRSLHLPSVVIIFEPQPEEFFCQNTSLSSSRTPPLSSSHFNLSSSRTRGSTNSIRLMSLREKILALKEFEIDNVLVMRFDKKLAALTAQQFVKNILLYRLAMKHLIIGDDFRFGHNGVGDFEYLKIAAKQFGFCVEDFKPFEMTCDAAKRRVSSTWVRQALQDSDLAAVKLLLGRDYSLCGHVYHGDKRGRLLNFPTANISLSHRNPQLRGVYVVQVEGINAKPYFGVANIGRRPTIKDDKVTLEVYLFDFDRDIYTMKVEVKFLQKIRDEQRFASFELLKEQIALDVEAAKEFLDCRS